MRERWVWQTPLLVAFVLIVLVPAVARAQSAIAGVVQDSSGGVLPGVAVEVASPVLIERVRTAVTDVQGRYQIVDLRPGTYVVTFTLAAFNTVRREGIELPANFTAQVNATLHVGAVEETVTVTTESPVVDVRNALVQNVMDRDTLDVLPTGRTYQSVAQTAPSVTLNRPDIAGTEAFFSTNLKVHGSLTRDQSIHLDGMDTSDGEADGRFQGIYRDDGDNEAVVYTTSALPAEVSKGGVRINMIGREGGNDFRGSFFFAEAPGGLQSDNFSADLQQRGLATPNEIRRIFDYNATGGGPIRRDRMWFFSSFRFWGLRRYAAGAFFPDGSRATDDTDHISASLRLTTQISERHKLMLFHVRMPRRTLFHRFVGPNVTPAASSRHTTPIVHSEQARWTSPATDRLLLEAGYSTTYARPKIFPQPEVASNPSLVRHTDLVLGTNTIAYPTKSDLYQGKWNYIGSLSYVTGSHAFKAGVQWSVARDGLTTDVNQHLVQEYRNGVPSSVLAYATPIDRWNHVTDLGIYAQDSWTLNRMTVNYGVRFEDLRGKVDASDVPAGRFVPARSFDEITDVPNWQTWSPRLGVVYDVFGTGKTAIKGSVSRYMLGESVSYTREFNPQDAATDRRTWTDPNRDDIAQDSEIGPPNVSAFGTRQTIREAPDGVKRPYQTEYNLTLQHELVPRVSVTAAWFYRDYRRLFRDDNVLVGPEDYFPVSIVSPLDGQQITIYNLNPAKRGAVDMVRHNSDTNRRKFNGFDMTVDARLGRGAVLFGGLSVGRPWEVNCDVEDPNNLRFCDQGPFIPYQTILKLSGAYRLLYGIQVSGTFQSYPGNPINAQAAGDLAAPEAGLAVNYRVTPALVPNLTQPLITVRLNEPGSKYLDRYNQLDLRVGKRINVGPFTVDANMDIFNLLNTNVVLRETEIYGPALGQPLEIPQGRLFRFGAQVRF
jgi:hypothetical protein